MTRVMERSIWRHISPLVAPRSLAHRVVDFHAVLGGVNALRCAPTARPARPRALTPPALRLSRQIRDGRGLIVVDSTRDEAYVRNISLSSTSPDVERFGMTLERLVPTAP
jgi:hypothetical protein